MNDFDFLIGSWTVTNRRLSSLFTGSDQWETFPGVSTCRPALDGGGTIEEIAFPTLGSCGLTLRLFDRERKEWSIYWASSRTGLLYPPVAGTFTDGRGDFYGDDTHDGKPVKAHFIWSDITPTSARWEQEFSADAGRTWESNWVMEYSRT
ncbi:hypothetical protein [Actinoplanes siamensis]|uniref:DUF1579 domain-containing protein n=1 Tax=Actinoplanes siamensis TaxID=1223317 RepID=A0A919KAP9_9ACTN|nr:hypothetical protein [Actinoplanes siamensis]GIF02618.1 hypothetical protein Asi03nite_01560 [Actinoplanes siamensis]